MNCYIGLRPNPDLICAPDQDQAAIQCTQGGGTYVPVSVCALSNETGDESGGPGGAPWDPGHSVTFDPDAGEFVIDEIAFEELKLDPAPVFLDSSELRPLETGYYQVAVEGELSKALGWRAGDILLAVDDHPLGSLADFAAAYTDLANNRQFAITLKRDRQKVVLRYRVQ